MNSSGTVIAFDLNGTLLDNRAVQPVLRSIFGAKLGTEEFFTRTLQYSMASSLAGGYYAFSDIALAVLKMEADARGLEVTEYHRKRFAAALKSLPPFPEVKRVLGKLLKAKFRLAVLTNSAYGDAREQLRNAKLSDYFERVLSVSEVRRFKPSPETYELALNSFGVQPHEMLMVAAHPWDLMGAAAVGCRTAFIQRTGKALFPLADQPDCVVRDLDQLAMRLQPSDSKRRLRLLPVLGAAGALSALVVAAGFIQSRPFDSRIP